MMPRQEDLKTLLGQGRPR
ncbi:unnamed protein product [Notodromas monacha]|uniref:Uncharacterized protein n=1 Tax=Notodromas monacha TaxID=399045 RepID=A0A7R9C402_9CRUS|nr:unnamed protein product [Notodromas monacha]CAG0925735.1 unnamed protein product [Notodromas monacha]